MKKINLLILFIGLLQVSFAQKSNLKIAVKSSSINWEGKKIVGGHVGTIAIKDGQLTVENNKIVGGEFTIDMPSMVCTDAAKLTAHLKNEDFFDVNKYPTAKFVITKVDNSKAKPELTGNLTIKDKTKSISFPISISNQSANGLEAEAIDVKVNRLDFDIRYGSSSFFADLGNRAIADEFILNIKIKAIK